MRNNLALNLPVITATEHVIAPTIARAIHHATRTIVARGEYTNSNGITVSIAALQTRAKQSRVYYEATQLIPVITGRYKQVHTYVYNQSVLTVAQERVRQGYRVAVLNFASQVHHDDPWLAGYIAQEESLVRSTSMMHCLADMDWYAEQHHAAPLYRDAMLITPRVPVFRDHGGNLLAEPWQCDVVHAYAIDARTVRQTMPDREAEIPQLMIERAQRVLHAAVSTHANVLVLGAWGCGQAGHDAAVMAAIWQVAIAQSKVNSFGIIDFAVPDIEPTQPVFLPFMQRLHQRTFLVS